MKRFLSWLIPFLSCLQPLPAPAGQVIGETGTAAISLWVHPTNGNDNNPCTDSTAPCATIQGALNRLEYQRIIRAQVTVNLAAGTYASGAYVVGFSFAEGGWLLFDGAGATTIINGQLSLPASPTSAAVSNSAAFFIGDLGGIGNSSQVAFKDMRFNSNVTRAVWTNWSGGVTFTSCTFDNASAELLGQGWRGGDFWVTSAYKLGILSSAATSASGFWQSGSFPGIWLGKDPALWGNSNYLILTADGGNTILFNTANGFEWRVSNSTIASMSSSGLARFHGGVAFGVSGASVTAKYVGTFIINFANIAVDTCLVDEQTISGALNGDRCVVTPSTPIEETVDLACFVKSGGSTVQIRACNSRAAGGVDPASNTFNVDIWR